MDYKNKENECLVSILLYLCYLFIVIFFLIYFLDKGYKTIISLILICLFGLCFILNLYQLIYKFGILKHIQNDNMAKRSNSNTKIMLMILLLYMVVLILLLALNQPYKLWIFSKYLILAIIGLILIYLNIIKNK